MATQHVVKGAQRVFRSNHLRKCADARLTERRQEALAELARRVPARLRPDPPEHLERDSVLAQALNPLHPGRLDHPLRPERIGGHRPTDLVDDGR